MKTDQPQPNTGHDMFNEPKSIAKFFTVWEAITFCSRPENQEKNLVTNRELDGRYHVYDMDA